MLRQRRPADQASTGDTDSAPVSSPANIKRGEGPRSTVEMASEDEQRPLLDSQQPNDTTQEAEEDMAQASWIRRNQWIVLALASGACAAFNGVFAKLTTTDLTTDISQAIARFLHLTSAENAIEVVVRAMFFGLNLIFNGVMWTLFTKALARGYSTTQVSIMNTSANFVITAVLGFVIFSEALPPLWWAGATLLVAGNVIIGSKDESGQSDENTTAAPAGEDGLGTYEHVPQAVAVLPETKTDEDDDILELGELED